MSKQKSKKTLRDELEMPNGVTASFEGQFLLIKGPAGEVKRSLRQQNVKIKIENNRLLFETERATKKDKKLMGSLIAHVKNMVRGIIQNHTYILKICAGHFPITAAVSGNKLTVKNFLGEKVPRVLHLKEGAAVKVDGQLVYVTSPNKEIAGQVAADIEQLTRRPGFDTRVFQDGIYLVNRDGKELK